MHTSNNKPVIGAISTGTLQPFDLCHRFIPEVRRLRRGRLPLDAYHIFEAAKRAKQRYHPLWGELLDLLTQQLEGEALPGTYFGSGQCPDDLGFWIDHDMLTSLQHDGDLAVVQDLADVPKAAKGLYMLMNDHGNTSLYYFRRGRGRLLWAVV